VIACLRRFLFAGFVDNDASPRFRLRAETRPGMCRRHGDSLQFM